MNLFKAFDLCPGFIHLKVLRSGPLAVQEARAKAVENVTVTLF